MGEKEALVPIDHLARYLLTTLPFSISAFGTPYYLANFILRPQVNESKATMGRMLGGLHNFVLSINNELTRRKNAVGLVVEFFHTCENFFFRHGVNSVNDQFGTVDV